MMEVGATKGVTSNEKIGSSVIMEAGAIKGEQSSGQGWSRSTEKASMQGILKDKCFRDIDVGEGILKCEVPDTRKCTAHLWYCKKGDIIDGEKV
jgi:hypothetical protein